MLLCLCAFFAACKNNALSFNDFPNDGKAHLLFSLKSQDFNNFESGRAAANPQVFSKDLVTDVVLRADGSDDNTKNTHEVFFFLREYVPTLSFCL